VPKNTQCGADKNTKVMSSTLKAVCEAIVTLFHNGTPWGLQGHPATTVDTHAAERGNFGFKEKRPLASYPPHSVHRSRPV
jgi:hypothetical protein